MNLVQQFGQNVRRERVARGLSQDELAVRANMRRSYVSDLERGTRNPSVQALGRIAAALEIDPARLLQG
jgi:transcriptional regulator with XRE-family HTH domain